ncbi:MAG: hypothetical protein ABI665_18900 [Vicinamibacterales bacterium]
MKANTAGAVVIGLAIIALFLLFGGGAMTGGRIGGGMMGGNMTGGAWMGGGGWMWIPALLIVCLVVMVVLGLFGKKQI